MSTIKLNKKEDGRKLHAHIGDEGLFLQEKDAYLPFGGSRRKWDDSRILISFEEFDKLVAAVQKVRQQ